MLARTPSIAIGILGSEPTRSGERHGCGLWPAGIAASLTAAEAQPVQLGEPDGRPWEIFLREVQGVVLVGHDGAPRKSTADVENLCLWCHKNNFPLLAVDHGLHHLNVSHGGSIYLDLPRDLPEAIQHRHPPERGLRHAINIIPKTSLAELYGEGEVVVNSEHRRAISRLARGFRVCATALDGMIEAIECENSDWFALGIQWQPASTTASGLDIQLFRGLIDACVRRLASIPKTPAA